MDGNSTPREDYHGHARSDAFPLVPEKAGRLLDLGGGIGATAAELRRMGRAEHTVVADLVDQPPSAGVDQTFSGNFEDEAFLDRLIGEAGPFDTILCLDVLEHLRDPWAVVARLHAGLAPGGVIVASLPNARNIKLVWPLVVHGRFTLTDAGICDRTHLRWFVRDTAIELMTSSGLALEDVRANMMAGRRYALMNMVTLGLFRRFFEMQYLIRVRKPG